MKGLNSYQKLSQQDLGWNSLGALKLIICAFLDAFALINSLNKINLDDNDIGENDALDVFAKIINSKENLIVFG